MKVIFFESFQNLMYISKMHKTVKKNASEYVTLNCLD